MDSYEQIRQRNIESNRKLLLSLNLAGPGSTPIIPKQSKPIPTVKRPTKTNARPSKPIDTESTGTNDTPTTNDAPNLNRRRSGRIQQIKERVKSTNIKDNDDSDYNSGDESSDDEEEEEENVKGHSKKRKAPSKARPSNSNNYNSIKRRRKGEPQRKARSLTSGRPNPKVFGHQIGVEVGDWWDARMSCSQAGVHAPPVSGIAGNETEGCWSVALSGGYEDDVDLGYAFTFTGAGGRALSGTAKNPKNLRTAPQTFDQEFTSLNAALRTSVQTKKPVRVIRGFKNHSPFAPEEGYRYDGLYVVERCWRELGQAGFQVCKFAFVRLPDQPKIPVKAGREAEAEQMYKDMGFVVDQLPASPEKRSVWTKTMANARVRAKPSEEVEPEEEDAAAMIDQNDQDVDENVTAVADDANKDVVGDVAPVADDANKDVVGDVAAVADDANKDVGVNVTAVTDDAEMDVRDHTLADPDDVEKEVAKAVMEEKGESKAVDTQTTDEQSITSALGSDDVSGTIPKEISDVANDAMMTEKSGELHLVNPQLMNDQSKPTDSQPADEHPITPALSSGNESRGTPEYLTNQGLVTPTLEGAPLEEPGTEKTRDSSDHMCTDIPEVST
ncbi:hypothetical protein CROQUDRAFT_132689 [Cronartium quercuum f. sp. fusiforme G11]|uniref:YDG domain-containing protein n=1 Tax=Cronartium quercuum f. sp. fusiforme G11 TaxID=708437 RepID=A0A9P6NN26_9BASI|nr:hypothetical protein CROQUDRAFT_132689 [Cronartium quercuum f. sp. fusiforme G11]